MTKNNPMKSMILRKGAEMLALRGFHATTTRDLAQEVGITQPSLYHYVSSKDELLREVLAGAASVALDEFAAIAALEVDSKEKLRRLIIHWASVVDRYYYEAIALIGHMAIDVPEASRRIIEETNEHYWDIWVGIIKEGVERGEFDAGADVQIVGLALAGMCSWMTMWYSPGGALKAESIGETLATMALAALAPDQDSPRLDEG